MKPIKIMIFLIFVGFLFNQISLKKEKTFKPKFPSLKSKLNTALKANMIHPQLPYIAHEISYLDQKNNKFKSYFVASSFKRGTSEKGDFAYIMGQSLHDPKVLIVSLRGTVIYHISNISSDLAFDHTQSTYSSFCNGCLVHEGFKGAYYLLKNKFFDDFEQTILDLYLKGFQIEHIIFTGHSLGGALAHFFAMTYWHRRNFGKKNDKGIREKLDVVYGRIANHSLITFGSPRVGNLNYVNYFMNTMKDFKWIVRVVYNKDVIADVPPKICEFDKKQYKYNHVGIRLITNMPFDKKPDDFEKPMKDKFEVAMKIFNNKDDHSRYRSIDGDLLWITLIRIGETWKSIISPDENFINFDKYVKENLYLK